jgi:hypothetical protein
MDPWKANAAIIQLRLRVWILPVDSKVLSSNMAASPECNSAAPAGRRRAFSRARERGRPARDCCAESGVQGTPSILIGTTVLV